MVFPVIAPGIAGLPTQKVFGIVIVPQAVMTVKVIVACPLLFVWNGETTADEPVPEVLPEKRRVFDTVHVIVLPGGGF